MMCVYTAQLLISRIINEKDSIPGTGLKCFPKNEFEPFPSRRCLQIHFTAFGIFLGEEVLTKNKTEWTAGCGGLGLAVEMFG